MVRHFDYCLSPAGMVTIRWIVAFLRCDVMDSYIYIRCFEMWMDVYQGECAHVYLVVESIAQLLDIAVIILYYSWSYPARKKKHYVSFGIALLVSETDNLAGFYLCLWLSNTIKITKVKRSWEIMCRTVQFIFSKKYNHSAEIHCRNLATFMYGISPSIG